MKTRIVHLKNPSGNVTAGPLSLRCPSCGQMGSFSPIKQASDVRDSSGQKNPSLGHRRCPNPRCHAHVFVVHQNREIIASYPPQRIDFDSNNVPGRVSGALKEAITCHAEGCFSAAAIMVRKTLEELCSDRNADGDNLYTRLESLRDKVLLPPELMDGLQDLRLLGNDAAHIEAQVYDDIGEAEVLLAVDVVKEVLKGVYQVGDLVRRLRARAQKSTDG